MELHDYAACVNAEHKVTAGILKVMNCMNYANSVSANEVGWRKT
jgi:hypothetical protein